MAKLTDFPYYEPNKPPQFYKYHSEVSYLDELEAITGKRWGAQGIGKLREVMMIRPVAVEPNPLFGADPVYFGLRPVEADLEGMQKEHDYLASIYRKEGITVHYMEVPPDAQCPYGPMKTHISGGLAFVINGGAIIGRSAAPYSRGREQHVSRFLQNLGCPILYTVCGKGVLEVVFSRMTDDFIVGMLSTDANEEGLEQVRPVLERAGYKEILIGRSPGPLTRWAEADFQMRHADTWIAPLDVRLALIYPAYCDYGVIRRLYELGYKLIEVPEKEQLRWYACNCLTLEPRRVVIAEGAKETIKAMKDEGVEVIDVPFVELKKYGPGIRCITGPLIRDPGPKLFE